MLAIATSPSIVFADEVVRAPGEIPGHALAPNQTPPTVPGPAPIPKVPTNVRHGVHSIVGVAGCGAAAKTCSEVVTQSVKASADKMATVNPPTAFAVAGCLVFAGYCAGKLSTKAIDKALGF